MELKNNAIDGRINGYKISRSIGISQDGTYLGCSAFQMKGRFKGYDISRRIGISQDGLFLGRPEFTGWGVSEDGVFQRMQRFSVKIDISQSI